LKVPEYTVKQGDCMMTIAEANGFLWETLWNHGDNAELKERRKDPNVLFPGDIVVIPELTPRIESAPTEERTTFVKKTNRVQVRLRLLDLKRNPRANIEYTATVDSIISSGRSDGEGYITLNVPPNASELKLKVTEGSKIDEYTLPLGSVDPIEELSGVQQRLTNLGYSCASEQGTLGELTRASIRSFQKEMNLRVSGDLDDATRQKLKEIHGS
jgi:N-acetylmuramoyl-L-alanine amidase